MKSAFSIKTKFTLFTTFLFSTYFFTSAQTLDNVRVEEQDDGKVAIYYDISGGLSFDVSVYCSTDFDTPLKNVSGDIGKGIGGGTNKKIIWDILSETSYLPPDVTFEVRAKYKAIELDLVLVKSGKFSMGSQRGSLDETPVHEVEMASFYISRHEITVREYRQFCQSTGRPMPSRIPEGGWLDNAPIVYVSWYDAQAFCEWAGGSLPTEAQWEYAAKGGSFSQYYQYSGSNLSTEVAWHDINARYRINPVGMKKPNELGIYDMSGNVSEWCLDWFYKDLYKKRRGTTKNPTGPKKGKRRTLRGGSFIDFSFVTRSAKRSSLPPAMKGKDIGFRIVRPVSRN